MSADILALMYHRVSEPNNQKALANFTDHLQQIANKYNIICPKQAPIKNKLNVCLTFDDAYYDFYAYVFPLLKKLQIKAILGVPVKYILENTNVQSSERLNVAYPKGMQDNLYKTKAPFCTWAELKEMQDTGFVDIACHSYSHPHIGPESDFNKEVIEAKNILQNKLNVNINYFIYPYGHFHKKTHNKLLEHYDFAFRIGSALNKGWNNKTGVIYRVDADKFWKSNNDITPKDLKKYTRKYWINKIRGK